MNLHRVVLRALLVSGVFLCQIYFQTAGGQVRPRVLEAVDDARRITLSGNVHPLARAEFDRGAVAESQAMNRILLLLKRSDEQEAALQDMLAKQQEKSFAEFPPVADAGAVRRTIRPGRRRYSGSDGLADAAGIQHRKDLQRKNGD